MKNDVVNKVLSYIETIGETMSGTAKQGFGIMVKQQFSSGLIDVLTSLPAAILLIYLTIKVAKMVYRKWDDIYSNDWEVPIGVLSSIWLICLMAFTLVAFFATIDGVKMMINPEYYAIKEILDTLKK